MSRLRSLIGNRVTAKDVRGFLTDRGLSESILSFPTEQFSTVQPAGTWKRTNGLSTRGNICESAKILECLRTELPSNRHCSVSCVIDSCVNCQVTLSPQTDVGRGETRGLLRLGVRDDSACRIKLAQVHSH